MGYDLNNRKLFPQSSGAEQSQITKLAGLVSSEASLFGSQMAAFSLSSRDLSIVCSHLCACPNFPSYKDTSLSGLGPTLEALFSLNHVCKGPIQQSHSEVLGARTQYVN